MLFLDFHFLTKSYIFSNFVVFGLFIIIIFLNITI